MPCQEPVLGINQAFPQRCADCNERFEAWTNIVMCPVLREGEVPSVGRLPTLNGEVANGHPVGRVLWAVWLCEACGRQRAGQEEQADEARAWQSAKDAERGLSRVMLAAARQRRWRSLLARRRA